MNIGGVAIMVRTNHELAKEYLLKQKVLGTEKLLIELCHNDGIRLIEVRDKDSGGRIVIPSFVTEMKVQHCSLWECGKGAFDECSFTDIYIDNPKGREISCEAIFSCMKSKRIRVQFANPEMITDMSYMFYGCKWVEEIELVKFNSINARSARSMFDGCRSLRELRIESINTANVIDMSYMFRECTELRKIDFSIFNTANVKYMEGIFFRCTALEYLDMSKNNLDRIEVLSYAFSDCKSLKELNLIGLKTVEHGYDINTISTINIGNTKELGITSLVKEKRKVKIMYMFNYCNIDRLAVDDSRLEMAYKTRMKYIGDDYG